MLSFSGSNSRKSVADWTFVNIHYFYKEGWIRESDSDSLLVSLILSEKPPNTFDIKNWKRLFLHVHVTFMEFFFYIYIDFLENQFVLSHRRKDFS